MTTRTWSRAETMEWLRARPARWLDPRLSAVGWGLMVALFVATDTGGDCSEAAPCLIDRDAVLGAIVLAVALAHIGWLLWVPEVAWITTPVIVVVSVASPATIVGGAAPWVLWLVVPAAAWTLSTLWRRRSGRVRQLEAVAPLASATPLPSVPAWMWERRTLRLLAGFAALAASVGLVAYTLHWQVSEDAHAREATRASGTVLGHLDDGYALRARLDRPGEGVRKLETFDASGYPVGSSVHVLVDGSWARLAAEPFDPTGWYMLAAGSALFGTTLVITVMAWRRRLAALSAGPVPALTVWVGPDHEGNAVVYAADDQRMDVPLLVVPGEVAEDEDTDQTGDSGVDSAEDDDLVEDEDHDEPGHATMFGLPCDGAAVVLRVEDNESLLLPRGPAHRPGRAHRGRHAGGRGPVTANR